MWYEKSERENKLDYSKPIIVKRTSGSIELLLPQIALKCYDIIGYNWFNIKSGDYGSSATFRTVEEALVARVGERSYNVKILIEKL